MKRITIMAAFLFSLLAPPQQTYAANLLINGDFELPNVGSGDAGFNATGSFITGWTITVGNVDLTGGCCLPAKSGNQAVDLVGQNASQPNGLGAISQTFATTAGQEYELSFWVSHNSGGGGFLPAASALVEVKSDTDQSLASFTVTHTVDPLIPQPNWQLWTQNFTALTALTTLSFTNTIGAFNGGIYLDLVSVVPVNGETPVPAALPLFAGGLGVMAFLARRRKQKTAMA